MLYSSFGSSLITLIAGHLFAVSELSLEADGIGLTHVINCLESIFKQRVTKRVTLILRTFLLILKFSEILFLLPIVANAERARELMYVEV